MKKNILEKVSGVWKFLFCIVASVCSVSIFDLLITQDVYMTSLFDKNIIVLFLFINLVGFYGLVWRKRILTMFFWRLFFVLIILFNIYNAVVGANDVSFATPFEMVSGLVIGLVLTLSVYIYAFRARYLWGV